MKLNNSLIRIYKYIKEYEQRFLGVFIIFTITEILYCFLNAIIPKMMVETLYFDKEETHFTEIFLFFLVSMCLLGYIKTITIIGKEYDKDGIELSGGEYQKIAIARAAYKAASLYIMDEPTSALDPITELEVFEDIQNIIESKTSIFVSHRMSSCKMCDNILVLDNGKIVESGTHDELIQKSGIYCKLYLAQSQVFSSKEKEK